MQHKKTQKEKKEGSDGNVMTRAVVTNALYNFKAKNIV